MLNLTEMRKRHISLNGKLSDTEVLYLLDIALAFKEYAYALSALSQMRGSCATASEIFDRTLKLLEDVRVGDE